MNKVLLVLLALVFNVHPVGAAGLTAKEVMEKNMAATRVKDVTANSTLTTGIKVKTFRWWRKLSSDGNRFNTLVRFDSPVEVRGQGVLFLEHKNNESDVLIYLPAYKKIRRVETQQQSASFMASEFSYADISSPRLSDYTYELMDTETCAGAFKCYVLEAKPANDGVRKRTGYSRKVIWIRSDIFVDVKADYYNLAGDLAKTMVRGDYQKNKNQSWLAMKMVFTNAKTKRVSRLEFSNAKTNTDIDDSIFTEQNLKHQK